MMATDEPWKDHRDVADRDTPAVFSRATDEMIAKRKAAGLLVDPGTAEICWVYGETPDRYGDLEVMPDEWSQIGRNYLARLSPADPWIWFDGLPDTVRDALHTKMRN
jgi:hypothetical protein